jgi:hypothetical protein
MISVVFAHCNFNMSPIDSKKVSKNKKVEECFLLLLHICPVVYTLVPGGEPRHVQVYGSSLPGHVRLVWKQGKQYEMGFHEQIIQFLKGQLYSISSYWKCKVFLNSAFLLRNIIMILYPTI